MNAKQKAKKVLFAFQMLESRPRQTNQWKKKARKARKVS